MEKILILQYALSLLGVAIVLWGLSVLKKKLLALSLRLSKK